jgi:uncharacterized membrane protein
MRYSFFDSYRGFALLVMATYHFCFDLNQFQVIHQDMNYDPFWLNFRAFIMTSFLGLVGVSFQFAQARWENRGFRKRLMQLAACAAIISATSYFMNPQTWIFFGVIHYIFLISLISPWLARIPNVCLILGAGIVLLPQFYRDPLFSHPALVITGLSPDKPITEDFSPLFPWLGVTMIGVWIGYQVQKRKPQWAQSWEIPKLTYLGRHSLVFYMTHQLVLYPLAWTVAQILN